MDKRLVVQYLICRHENAIGFLYGHQGLLFGDYVSFAVFSETGEISERLVSILSLTLLDPERKIEWIMDHIAELESWHRGTVVHLAEYNNVFAEVLQHMVDLCVTYQKQDDITQTLGFAPDGCNGNQNAAVGLVKELVATWFNKPDVLMSISALHAAIASNEPKLTAAEAMEIHHQLYGFYCGYFGCQETRLFDLLQAIEEAFPEVDFSVNEVGEETRGDNHGDSP